jgi:hypothetical protein
MLLVSMSIGARAQTSAQMEWFDIHDGDAHAVDIPNAATLDRRGNLYITVYVAGSGAGPANRLDYVALKLNQVSVAVGESPEYPTRFALHQNHPNPFNPSTTFTFDIPYSIFVILRVYDVLGREVTTLVNEVKQPGRYEVTWDGSGIASGVYFYRLQAGGFVTTKKLNLIR